jgi:hypothetical protein
MEILKPVIVKIPELNLKLQFFVSADGQTCGMSQASLALLCGMPEEELFGQNSLIGQLSQRFVRPSDLKKIPVDLRHYRGQVFLKGLMGNFPEYGLARIINNKAADTIIYYYAYEHQPPNPVAHKSFEVFSYDGIDNWIKSATGYTDADSSRLEEIELLLTEIIGKIREIEEEVRGLNLVVKAYLKKRV